MRTKTDTSITADVLAELAWDPAVTVADLDVTVLAGQVTVSGTTATYSSKDAAEEAAYRVAGVRGVTDFITVDRLHTDDAIAEDVRSALTMDTRIPLEAVSVAVHDGIVTLSGNLDHHYQREAAEDDTARIAGMTGVTDLIRVTSPAAIAADVTDKISAAFARTAELADDHVRVAVNDHTVTLSGTVRTWSEFDEATTAAWHAAGVSTVVNNLSVTY
jgi:osmotically-inducible protein OsmY